MLYAEKSNGYHEFNNMYCKQSFKSAIGQLAGRGLFKQFMSYTFANRTQSVMPK